MFRFAFRGRWLVGHFVVLAVAALFVRLGFWQLDRLDHVRTQNALVTERRSLPPADLTDLVKASDATGAPALQRRVEVAGRYDPTSQAVEFHSLDGRTGVNVLTPLVTSDGTAVIVDRGWVPAEPPEESIPPNAAPPAGEVRVSGLALPGDMGGTASRNPGDGVAQVTRIDLGLLQRGVPYDLYPVYVRLLAQDPPQGSALPRPVPPPPLDEGPHLSYAVQWFLFATIGLVGWPILLRRTARDRRFPRQEISSPR